MNKKSSLTNDKITELLNHGYWPQLTDGRTWKKSSDSLKHVCRMVKKLDEMGMPPEEAAEMIRHIYWCAYGDIQDMPKLAPRDKSRENNTRYFDEFGIMFSVRVADLTPEELKRDYEFYCNLYAQDGTIWWAVRGGSAGGGPLHNFLNVVRMDNNYAFGPTKPQSGWSAEELAKLNAVGVYKRKEPPKKLGRAAENSPQRRALKRK